MYNAKVDFPFKQSLQMKSHAFRFLCYFWQDANAEIVAECEKGQCYGIVQEKN